MNEINTEVMLRDIHDSVEPSGFAMRPRTLEEAMKFCEIMANSDLVPGGYKGKPGNIMVAIQMGNEIGLTPMRALRCIAVINGRASMWGDEMLAMVQASPLCEYVDESESTEKVGICKTKRKGCVEQVSTFTLEDAKRAGLLGKQGPWQQHTGRMLKLRARGFGLRDTFADVLAGLVTVEEALDIPEEPKAEVQTAEKPSLKERLKAKVEVVTEPASIVQEDPEPTAQELAKAIEPLQDNDPAEPYRAKLRTCERSNQAINATYQAIPEYIRQDCHEEYTAQLKSISKKRGQGAGG